MTTRRLTETPEAQRLADLLSLLKDNIVNFVPLKEQVEGEMAMYKTAPSPTTLRKLESARSAASEAGRQAHEGMRSFVYEVLIKERPERRDALEQDFSALSSEDFEAIALAAERCLAEVAKFDEDASPSEESFS